MPSVLADSNLNDLLTQTLGYPCFKSIRQENAAIAVNEGVKDVFVSMPPGSGKSLCYELPALTDRSDRISLVIVPLACLIQERMAKIKRCTGTDAVVSLTPISDDQERGRILSLDFKMLYTTPEIAMTLKFEVFVRHLYERQRLARIVVHDVQSILLRRRDMDGVLNSIGKLRSHAPNVQLVVVTTNTVDKQYSTIYRSLSLRPPVLKFSSSVFRSNLYYDVFPKEAIKDKIGHLKRFIAAMFALHPKGRGMIFCRTGWKCDYLCGKLELAKEHTFERYHTKMADGHRQKVENRWSHNLIDVLIVTNPPYVGKDDVRFCVHWDAPTSMLTYSQHTNYVGRDGQPSHCRLYCSAAYTAPSRRATGKEERRDSLHSIHVTQYCSSQRCRHAMIADCFGERISDCRTMCDTCTNPGNVKRMINKQQASTSDPSDEKPTSIETSVPGGLSKVEPCDTGDGASCDEFDAFDSKSLLLHRESIGRTNLTTPDPTLPDITALSESKLVEGTNLSVEHLSVKNRLTFVGHIRTQILSNCRECNHCSDDLDVETRSYALEGECFCSARNLIAYRLNIMQQLNKIREATKQKRHFFEPQGGPTGLDTRMIETPASPDADCNVITANAGPTLQLKQWGSEPVKIGKGLDGVPGDEHQILRHSISELPENAVSLKELADDDCSKVVGCSNGRDTVQTDDLPEVLESILTKVGSDGSLRPQTFATTPASPLSHADGGDCMSRKSDQPSAECSKIASAKSSTPDDARLASESIRVKLGEEINILKRLLTDPAGSSIASSPVESSISRKRPAGAKFTSNAPNASMSKRQDKKLRPENITISIKSISEIVIETLNPFYTDKRIASKELFKVVAKQISHNILGRNPSSIKEVRYLATNSINSAFRRIKRVRVEQDANEFVI